MSVFRTLDNMLIDTINIGTTPGALAITPDGSLIYAANQLDDTISVIRTSDNVVIETIIGGDQPFGVSTTPSGDFVYITNNQDDNVSVIRTSDNIIIDTITVGDRPFSFGMFITDGPTTMRNVPTLSQWGLIFMIVLFGSAGLLALRRKSVHQN